VELAEQQRNSAGAGYRQGLLVITLSPASPADKAGLLIGDIIVAVNGAPTDRLGSLQTALDPEQVGKQVALRIVRGGETREIGVVVGEREE
jgi:S1-C subfamily serine protease